jgi:hypothetical protein
MYVCCGQLLETEVGENDIINTNFLLDFRMKNRNLLVLVEESDAAFSTHHG